MVYSIAELAKKSGFSRTYWTREIESGRLEVGRNGERGASVVSDSGLEAWYRLNCAAQRIRDPQTASEREVEVSDRLGVGPGHADQGRSPGVRTRGRKKGEEVRAIVGAALPGARKGGRKARALRKFDKAG